MDNPLEPGPVVLFGSGETSPSGRQAFDLLLRGRPPRPQIALLETPAGFELNSDRVIGRVADFLRQRLQNYEPQVQAIPARRRGTAFSPDNPQVVTPLLEADLIFMGPGSPTYAVRQLRDSLAWSYLIARHRLGAALVLASAAAIALSAYALPVYEIYKVGEDLHWKPGLDFFAAFGLPLVFIPHWNNHDGGAELDTSRCFMGQSRFAGLMACLPAELTVVGIDEKTALTLDLPAGLARVTGLGGVTLLHTGHRHPDRPLAQAAQALNLEQVVEQRDGHVHSYLHGEGFPLSVIGDFYLPDPSAGLPPEVWQQAQAEAGSAATLRADRAAHPADETDGTPPAEVLALVAQRESARQSKDWDLADALRSRLAGLGWQVSDTPDGPRVTRVD